jgi:RNA recognition motif-containing protein
MRILVGNLSMPITEDDLRQLFEPYGKVEFVQIIADQTSGEGQGFVLMPDDQQAQAAIDGLQGTQHKGRTLTIHAAHWQW